MANINNKLDSSRPKIYHRILVLVLVYIMSCILHFRAHCHLDTAEARVIGPDQKDATTTKTTTTESPDALPQSTTKPQMDVEIFKNFTQISGSYYRNWGNGSELGVIEIEGASEVHNSTVTDGKHVDKRIISTLMMMIFGKGIRRSPHNRPFYNPFDPKKHPELNSLKPPPFPVIVQEIAAQLGLSDKDPHSS